MSTIAPARRLPGIATPACHTPTGESESPMIGSGHPHSALTNLPSPESVTERQQRFLATPDGYQPGAIICCSWGWEQTNINFYRIEKRSGAFVTLIPVSQTDRRETQFMSGTCMPSDTPKDYLTDHDPAWGNKDLANPKPSFRRKLSIRDGVITGVNVLGHGWASLWRGTPMSWSSYA